MFRSSAATPTARRLLGASAIFTAAVSLAACGGSATKSLSAPSVKPVATDASTPEPSVAPTADASTDALSSSAAGAPATTPSSAAAVSGGSDPGSSFCTFAKNEEAQSQKFATNLSTATPDAVKAYIVQAMQALGEFEKAAPSAIASEVKAVVSLDQKLFAALEADGYNFAKAAPTFTEAAMDPAFTAAIAKLGTYLMSTCGIAATS